MNLFVFFVVQVMDYWNHTDFQLAAHPGRDIAIITGTDDVITSLEESIVTLANIRGSRFVTPIKVRLWTFYFPPRERARELARTSGRIASSASLY